MNYPVGKVWSEAQLVIERLNSLEVTRATLLQLAVSSVLSKEAGEEFRKALDSLKGD